LSRKITLITGGLKSGKSSFSLDLVKDKKTKAFIATAVEFDGAMSEKIIAHKKERDESYITIEEPVALAEAVRGAEGDVILIDCITMWVNNLIYYEKDISLYSEELFKVLSDSSKEIIIVTNEVGLGVASGDKTTNFFIQELGIINKKLAGLADNVYMCVSGIPVMIKGE